MPPQQTPTQPPQSASASNKRFWRWAGPLAFIILFALAATYFLTNSRADTGTAPGSTNSPSFMQVPAWTNVSAQTRYPAGTGTFDVSNFKYTAGQIGLNSGGAVSHGVATFFWTSDAAGQHIVGVQGMNLSSLIVSQNLLRMPNQGPYLYWTFKPYQGPCPFAANLFASNVGNSLQEIPGDTILTDEKDKTLAPHSSTTIYPDDYFAGSVRAYLSAPAGVTTTFYGADLTDQFWPLDSMGPGSVTTITPMGTWMNVITNNTGAPVKYTLSVTPLVTGSSQ